MRMRTHLSTVSDEFELTPAQAMALKNLEPQEPITMSALATHLLCDASNITGIVDKLEARGLIIRRADEHDRRVKMLVVTEEGAKFRRRFIDRLHEPPPAFRGLASGDHQKLQAIVSSLLARWQDPLA